MEASFATENVASETIESVSSSGRLRKVRRILPDGSQEFEDEFDAPVKPGYAVEDKLSSEKFSAVNFVQEMHGYEVTIAHFQRDGFIRPILVKVADGLGIKVPNVGIHEIRGQVGSRRYLDVMDVTSQKNIQMTMKEFSKYWTTPPDQRTQLLNVISLEFSNTKLDPQVVAPRIVRQIDWVDKVWPRHLKELQIESTNSLEDMMYPKVQKYCLMSVKKCWTDFHIDLGGTSVWYHLLEGRKIFWLIPPTDENLKKYESWIKMGKQSETFFGDLVDNCQRVQLVSGNTFFIPSGWIHAVYTPEDSIVFGGNFLHSFGIEKQLQVAHLEEVVHVESKFRFPFFTEMLWYALDRYVHCIYGRSHLDLPEEEKRRIRLEKGENVDPNKDFLKLDTDLKPPTEKVHLTSAELNGLKYIVMYLHHIPASKKNVPILLPDPIALIRDIRNLVLEHRDDCPDAAITGKYILRWSENDDVDAIMKRARKLKEGVSTPGGPVGAAGDGQFPPVKGKPGRKPKLVDGSVPAKTPKKPAAGNRRRRVRCKNCEACLGQDCKQCTYCQDMTKYGGPGRMKQTCEKRRCLQPQLPICAYCEGCKLDGWYNEPKLQVKETERPEEPPKLFECTVCLRILHPDCAEKTIGTGKINRDLSNSWECAQCMNQPFSSNTNRAGQKRPGEEDMDESKRMKVGDV